MPGSSAQRVLRTPYINPIFLRTTEKPIRNASTNTTPPPYHSRACKAQPCRSFRASKISSARPRTIGISERANTSVFRDFLSVCGVAAAKAMSC